MSAVFLRDARAVVLRSQRMDRRRKRAGGATEVAVEAPLAMRPDETARHVRQGGRTMQPGCVALMSPQSALDETVQHVFAGLIGQKQYDHWFRDRTELVLGDGELVVRAASPFLLKWLQKQFKDALSRAAQQALGPAARVRYDSAVATGSNVTGSKAIGSNVPGSAVTGAAVSAPEPALPPRDQPKLAPPAVELSPSAAGGESMAIARVTRTIPAIPASEARPAGRRFADLGDFVAGPCNELALTAVRQICTRPDSARGPLVLYGPVGTGKTHLLEGIHRQLRRTRGDLQAVFLTAEQFTNYFTQAYRDHTLPAFRQRFRTVDVLLVDDVDFLDGKRVVQEEFLHTFKQLESFGKLVVLCADRHPRLLAKTSDELRTRFLSGMVCRLETPDLETRERIVSRKAAALDAEFTPETLKYVAGRFSGNVRELEGALQCLQVYYRMTGKRVGITAARQTLSDLERDCLRVVRLADIERVVCDLFGVDADDLRSSSRTRSVCEPRMLAMYLARRHTRSAYSEIGRHFGGRNHATVIAAERKVTDWLQQGTSVRVASRTWQLGDILETLEQQLQVG